MTIDRAPVIEELRGCYANKLNTVSIGARRKANRSKKRFMGLVMATSKIEGTPINAKHDAIMVLHLQLPRIDWDAPVKAICDALQEVALGSRDDAQIKYAFTFLSRPSKRKKRKAFIVAEFYDATTERSKALARCSQLLENCVALSGHGNL